MRIKNLHLATSINTKGGITSVVKAILQFGVGHFHVPAHSDKSTFKSMMLFANALVKGFFYQCNSLIVHYGGETSAFRKYILSCIYRYDNLVVYQHIALEGNDARVGYWERILLSKADKIIVLGTSFKNRLGPMASKAYVLGNFTEDTYVPVPKKNQVLFAGTFDERKGVKHLLSAFMRLEVNDWDLILVGAGREYRTLFEMSRTFPNIHVLNWIGRDEMSRLMNETKIFCLPSSAEGLSVAIIEAVAHDCLPVITRVGCHLEYFGDDVIWCEPNSPDSILHALRRAMREVDHENYKGSRHIYEREFRLEDYIDRLEKILS